LRMRPVESGDLEDLVTLHADPATVETFGEAKREEIAEWIERAVGEWEKRGHGRVAILDRESGEFLGRSGLKYWPEFDEVEVSWALTPAARGRGVATEAATACLEWGFRDLEVPYITAMIAPDNAASAAVAGRLGMTPLREDELHGRPIVVHALRG
jgi:RimJ/RimL family protein N-acetyltransferase